MHIDLMIPNTSSTQLFTCNKSIEEKIEDYIAMK